MTEPTSAPSWLQRVLGLGRTPSDSQARARQELLDRLGTAYKALDQARGWAEQVDYTLLGFDSREDLYKFLDEGKSNTERMIDALDGSKWDQATLFWDRIRPALDFLKTIASHLSGLGL